VIEAKDGAQGLAMGSSVQPDAILCDIHMPVMVGFDFIAWRRQNPDLSTLPVIMITSQSNRDPMRRAMGNGSLKWIGTDGLPIAVGAASHGSLLNMLDRAQ